MAVGSFDFSDVVDEAVERSGGQEATASDVNKVRRGLRILTERWIAQGYNTWRIESLTKKFSGTTTHVHLPDSVDDVVQVNSIRNGATELPMERISPHDYMVLASKTTQGQPSQFYLDRKEKPTLFVYPIGTPDVDDTVQVYYVARPADYDRYGDTTDDVPGRWLEALISGLALDLARKRPPYNEPLIQRLKGEYMEAEDLAQRADRGRQNYRYRITC